MRYLQITFSFVFLLLLGVCANMATASSPPTDSDINFWVKGALMEDPRVLDFEIASTTEEGVVTLSGFVDNLAAKTYAVREVKKINGVKAVIDKLMVEPSFRSDTDIAHAVRRRILSSSSIKTQGITVSSKDGVVVLSGTVDSYSEEQQAKLLASEVGGVKEVKNNITTKWSMIRPDAEIKGDVEASLHRDVYLSGMPISVNVENGVVTLSGHVGNAYEKDRAEDDAHWVSNVLEIKNNLSIEWYDEDGVREDRKWLSEEELAGVVRKALNQDSRLAAYDITVVAQYGHVTLDGVVSTHYEKRIAEKDARNVVGVAWVTNNLITRIDQREDWAIEGDIDFNLSTDAVLKPFDVSATVVNGTVTLTGVVHTWYQKIHAYDVASRVLGVKNVVNKVVINREKWKTDAELVKAVKSRLKKDWKTWWISNKINVTVKDFVATLEGDVHTWAQRNKAGELALHTTGIRKVDNRLTVKGFEYPWDEYRSE